jgi:hypothetical protein
MHTKGGDELRRLLAERVAAANRAAETLRSKPPKDRLLGDALRRAIDADETVATIDRRIREMRLGRTAPTH